jgi:tetratricopeptide (TPR) repeat protein
MGFLNSPTPSIQRSKSALTLTPTALLPTPTLTPSLEQIDLGEALDLVLVEASFFPKEGFGEQSILLLTQSFSSQPLLLNLKPGAILLSPNPLESSFVLTGEIYNSQGTPVQMELRDSGLHEYYLEAYLLDYTKNIPAQGANLTYINPIPSEIKALLEGLTNFERRNNLSLSPDVIQAGIWVISGGIDQSQAVALNLSFDLSVLSQFFDSAGIYTTKKRMFDSSVFGEPNGYLRRGNGYFELGEYVQAIDDYNQAIYLITGQSASTTQATPTPGNPAFAQNDANRDMLFELYFKRGIVFLQIGDYAKAKQDFETLANMEARDPFAHFGLGLVYSTQPDPDYEPALLEFDQALINNFPFEEAYLARGNVWAALGEFETAIDDFSQAIKIDNNFLEAYFARGKAYGAIGEFKKAERDFKWIVDHDPNFSPVYRERAMAFLAVNNTERAISELGKYLMHDPNAPDRQEILDLHEQLVGNIPTPIPGQVISITDAISAGWVSVQLHGLGVTSGDSILLSIIRQVDFDLQLQIPTGLLLVNTSLEQTDMVVRKLRGKMVGQTQFEPVDAIHLTDNLEHAFFVEAYSLDFDLIDPKPDTTFTVIGKAEEEISRILQAIVAGIDPECTRAFGGSSCLEE